MTYKIDKNIPSPTEHHSTKYPWMDMEIGDSIFVEGETGIGPAADSARHWGRNNKKRLCSRIEGTGVRIWRVE